MNKVTLIGHLGKDPEIKTIPSGKKVAQFSLATSENRKNQNGEWESFTTWHRIVVWEQRASYAEKYLKKGSLIAIEGKISNRTYEDKNGVKREISEVVGTYLKGLDKRDTQQTPKPAPAPEPTTSGITTASSEDYLPF